ncbi:hypothetical protein VM1G_08242 [Cytospora mali]|uniref:Zn(2)-C6 fungal-type domain-containing protein n=1 Tax=Cytospora mali TaxID=578113 RepID=A0A194W992_CYTMA|nr:hypothetical protein VM1G_08242 [Valsa mali]
MFGTFRYNDSMNEAEYVELSPNSGVDARGYTLVACNLCRARKLKCSGDRNGCDRCLASSSNCTYPPSRDGYWAGRSTGASKQRRRQSIPASSSSTNDNDQALSTAQRGRPNGPSRGTNGRRHGPEPRDFETGEGRQHQRANGRNRDRPQTPPSATSVSAPGGSSSRLTPTTDAPPSTSWSSDLFDFNDFTDTNGDSPNFMAQLEGLGGLDRTNSIADSSLVNAIFNMTPEPLPPLTQPPDLPAPSIRSASVSVPEDPLGLTSQKSRPRPPQASPPPRTSSTGGDGTGGCSSCKCLPDLAGILERLGRYRLGEGKPKAANNLDCLLFCLGTGVSTCKKVLSCARCDACQEHSILIATIAQQLTHVCNDLCACILVHQHKAKTASSSSTNNNNNNNNNNTTAPSPSSSPSSLPSGAAAAGGEDEEEALVDGEISFGRYQIQGVEMRLRLVQNLMALHMTDLMALLGQLWQRMGHVQGASGMLTEARKTAHTAHWMLQRMRAE